MLKVDDIHVYYGAIHAVKGVSFEVHPGEIVALIGANGAGKSTILKTVSDLSVPVLPPEELCLRCLSFWLIYLREQKQMWLIRKNS